MTVCYIIIILCQAAKGSVRRRHRPVGCTGTAWATLGLRPEHLQLQADAPWRGQVLLVEPTGADTFVVVETASGPVTVRVAPQTPVQVGEPIGLAVSAAHANWFDSESGRRLA